MLRKLSDESTRAAGAGADSAVDGLAVTDPDAELLIPERVRGYISDGIVLPHGPQRVDVVLYVTRSKYRQVRVRLTRAGARVLWSELGKVLEA
jgi:hypothetical protein